MIEAHLSGEGYEPNPELVKHLGRNGYFDAIEAHHTATATARADTMEVDTLKSRLQEYGQFTVSGVVDTKTAQKATKKEASQAALRSAVDLNTLGIDPKEKAVWGVILQNYFEIPSKTPGEFAAQATKAIDTIEEVTRGNEFAIWLLARIGSEGIHGFQVRDRTSIASAGKLDGLRFDSGEVKMLDGKPQIKKSASVSLALKDTFWLEYESLQSSMHGGTPELYGSARMVDEWREPRTTDIRRRKEVQIPLIVGNIPNWIRSLNNILARSEQLINDGQSTWYKESGVGSPKTRLYKGPLYANRDNLGFDQLLLGGDFSDHFSDSIPVESLNNSAKKAAFLVASAAGVSVENTQYGKIKKTRAKNQIAASLSHHASEALGIDTSKPKLSTADIRKLTAIHGFTKNDISTAIAERLALTKTGDPIADIKNNDRKKQVGDKAGEFVDALF